MVRGSVAIGKGCDWQGLRLAGIAIGKRLR